MHFMRFAPKCNDYSLDRYRTQVRRVLNTLEKRVGEEPSLGGASHSIADIATFLWARGIGTFPGKAAEADHPKLMAWVKTIAPRSPVQRALAAVDDMAKRWTGCSAAPTT